MEESQASAGLTIWRQRSFGGVSHTVSFALEPRIRTHFPTTAGPWGPSPFKWVFIPSNPEGSGQRGPASWQVFWGGRRDLSLLSTFPTLFPKKLNQRTSCSCRPVLFWLSRGPQGTEPGSARPAQSGYGQVWASPICPPPTVSLGGAIAG